jgi:hypothetical protein
LKALPDRAHERDDLGPIARDAVAGNINTGAMIVNGERERQSNHRDWIIEQERLPGKAVDGLIVRR